MSTKNTPPATDSDGGPLSSVLSAYLHEPRNRQPVEAGLQIVLLIAPLVIALLWGDFFDQSAYVTFRYARNLTTARSLERDSVAGGVQAETAEGRTEPLLPPCEFTREFTRERSSRLDWKGLVSPLYTLALALPAALGIPVPQASLVLSALAWGATAITMYNVGRAIHQPVAAAISATLVVFNPAVVSTLGTEIPWAIVFAWVAIASSIGSAAGPVAGPMAGPMAGPTAGPTAQKRWSIQAGALALMLGTHVDVSTLAMAALLLAVQWSERRRFPLPLSLILLAAALGWGTSAGWRTAPLLSPPHLTLAEWQYAIQRLLDESEFYWFFLPLLLCGGMRLWVTSRKALWAGLLWGAASILGDSEATGAMGATLGLFLAGLGVAWAIAWIGANVPARADHATLTLTVGLALAAGLLLGTAQVSSLLQRAQLRPVAWQELERQAADWLRANSEPLAVVLASERVGYLAQRPTLVWPAPPLSPPQAGGRKRPFPSVPLASGEEEASPSMSPSQARGGKRPSLYVPLASGGEEASPSMSPSQAGGRKRLGEVEPEDLIRLLVQSPPSYCVSFRSIAWGRLTRSAWFQDSYMPLQRFETPYDAASPIVIWGYRFDTLARPVQANLRDEINLLSFAADASARPGAKIEVRLYWEARRKPKADYVVFVHLLDGDGHLVANHDGPPRDGQHPSTRWIPGEIVIDVHHVALAPEIPPGTYRLQAGMYVWPSLERLPVWDRRGVEQPDRTMFLQTIQVQ